MNQYKCTESDWEKAKRLKNRYKRINLIKEIKNKAIELQDYSSVVWIRNIEKNVNAYFLYEDEAGIEYLFELITNKIDDLEDGEFKKYMISISREYKIQKLLGKKT